VYPSDILDAYRLLGQQLAGQIAPCALHLLYALLTIEVLVIAVTYMLDSDEPTG
jgi:hypothetical protein